MKNFVVLAIIDGLGISKEIEGNAFAKAKTPFLDKMMSEYPTSFLKASGQYVGLPENQMGNSEVGHLNIGAGRVVYTGLSLIKNAIETNKFKDNPLFQEAFEHAKKHSSTLHLMGLFSEGGVHSLDSHLFLLIEAAAEFGLKKVSIHVFGDGRDVLPQSILKPLTQLQKKCDSYGFKISSISGRYYSMDRDKMWERTTLGLEALEGKSNLNFERVTDYVESSYQEGIYDEFLKPAIAKDGIFLEDNDALIFTNFRPDRARQITHLILDSPLYEYKYSRKFNNIFFVSMMKYEGLETNIAFEEKPVELPLGEYLSEIGFTQLRVAETQKYAHVTYFFDGGIDVEYKNSKRIMVDSLKVATYDKAPQMSAAKITEAVIENAQKFDFTVLNYANPDMVGHTGEWEATLEAVETIDQELSRLKDFCDQNNATLFISADHGNAELMIKDNKAITQHTTNDVFFISSDKNIKLKDGMLADIAPTILEYFQIKQPQLMSGQSLLSWKTNTKNLAKNSLGYDNNLFIYQDKSMFNYSVDTILLGNFVTINSKVKRMLEVGSNNGALSIFIAKRKENLQIDGIEILSKACQIANINIKDNQLEEQIKIYCVDFLEFAKTNKTKYDSVVVNPPFFKENQDFDKKGTSFAKYVATHEVYLKAEDLVKNVSTLLKDGGYFALVIIAERIFDFTYLLKDYGFEIKRIQMVFPRIHERAKFVLLEARWRGKEGLVFEPNLYLHPEESSAHEYTEEIKKLYKPIKSL